MPIVSSTDGTQTFGLSAMAMFPKQDPTITMPPYTELEFPLYLKPTSQRFEDVVEAVFKSLRQPSTPLNVAFFARENVDELHEGVQARIAEGMGLAIDRQSDWELLLIMRRVYLETASNWPDDVDEEVERLNSVVLQLAAESVARNITKYLTFRTNLAQPSPMPNPSEMLIGLGEKTGTPAPLVDLNADYTLGIDAFMASRRRTMTPAREIS